MNLLALALRQGDDERRACFALVEEVELQASSALPAALLSEFEQARFEELLFPLKRRGFLLGRLAAKRALGALLAEPDLRRIEIRSGLFGQPMVHHPRADCAEVTVSHSQGLAVALAYSGEFPVGVDLETVATGSADTILGELQISDAEKVWLASETVGRATACGILWTGREALGKSMKIGLSCPLGILSFGHIESAGAAAWIGQYENFPQFRCLSQEIDGRVLSIAMPVAVELASWPLAAALIRADI